ncbi:cytochrome P450 11B, mitochondrial-like [Pristis pectinata]|uniref:cytochrome P450 11B, mitochondrial-like n=1 Tax=Pristis pectinata TaxID=685728 RepID=UPI00223D19B5|nr:cytochrome P450 11B, mitochondrial-like [Pristis pectinata]
MCDCRRARCEVPVVDGHLLPLSLRLPPRVVVGGETGGVCGMGAVAKLVSGGPAAWLGCCVAPQPDGKQTGSDQTPKLNREEYRRHLEELDKEKRKRDEAFAQRKAERAAMRIRLRERYQLRQDERDGGQLRSAPRTVEVPAELAAIARTERGPSLLGDLPGLTQLGTVARDTAAEGRPLPYRAIPSTGGSGWVNLYRLWRSGGFVNRHLDMTQNFERLGPIYREKLGMRETVNIFHPEDTAVLFRSEGPTPERMTLEAWVEHREYREHKCGIFLKNGEEWRRDRMLLNREVMSPAAARNFGALLEPVARDFALLVDRRLRAGSDPSPTNILPELFRFALEGSFHLLYGERLGLFGDVVSRQSDRFIWAIENMLRTTTPLLHIPAWLYRGLRLRAWRDHVHTWDIIFEHADRCMKELVRKVQNVPEAERGYQGVLGELVSRSKLPFNVIKANSTELMVGSVDTTAHSLLFTLFELARNPELQDSLRREVTEAHQRAQGDVGALFLNAPLLRATIKETLRLYPVGLTLQRYPVRDIVLRNYHVPTGTLVQVVLYSLGRSPEIFPEPRTYNPSRWLSGRSHPFQALAFGFGVRQCVGRRVAELEIGLFLVHILRKFQIVSPSKADIELTYAFIVMVDNPPLLAFRPIPGRGSVGGANPRSCCDVRAGPGSVGGANPRSCCDVRAGPGSAGGSNPRSCCDVWAGPGPVGGANPRSSRGLANRLSAAASPRPVPRPPRPLRPPAAALSAPRPPAAAPSAAMSRPPQGADDNPFERVVTI